MAYQSPEEMRKSLAESDRATKEENDRIIQRLEQTRQREQQEREQQKRDSEEK